MRSTIGKVLLTASVVAILAPARSICAAQQPTTAADAAGRTRTAELLAWYDTLGFPDTIGRPYVRVTTGWWRRVGDAPPENQYVEGFLLREDAASFTVFISGVSTLGVAGNSEIQGSPRAPLDVFRFVRKADGPEHERVLYERIDLAARARDVLDRGRSFAAAKKSGRIWFDFGSLPTQRAQIFVFARAALQNGLQREASALFELIERRLPVEKNDQNLLHELQRSIGEAVLAQMEANALDPSHSREEMLQAYSTFAQRFPASDKVPYTRAAVEALQRMIDEGRTHPARSIATLAPAEQAAEWIHRLRDTKIMTAYWVRGAARYPMFPGTLQDESEKTPVHHLVDLGDAAVPALLDALADESFTRTAVASFKGGPPRPMRVSDFARGILEFMASRTFGGPEVSNTAARPAAEAWWAELQSKGARQ